MNNPLITIGITCFNASDTISRALDSAVKQDWSNFEIIVVDDDSTDESVAIVEKYAAQHSKIKFIQNSQNKGFPGALNVILSQARGEFVAIFDDDDVSHPNRLSTQYKRISEYEHETGDTIVACYGSRIKIYENGYRKRFEAIGSRHRHPRGEEFIDYTLFFDRKPDVFFGSGTPSCALMARKRVFDLIGFYDENLRKGEDIDFGIRLALSEGTFIGCPEILIEQYATQGSDKAPSSWLESQTAVVEKYRTYLESKKRYYYAKNWQRLRYYYFSGHLLRAFFCVTDLFVRHPRWTLKHFIQTAPRRLLHDYKITRRFD